MSIQPAVCTPWWLLTTPNASATGRNTIQEIVAVCREHGVTTVLSEDRDFRRFPSVTLQTLPVA